MRVLVTGASGNVGTALLRRLADEPDVEVVGLSRRVPPEPGGGSALSWVSADLGSPSSVPVLEEALAGVDAVVHLAWRIQPSHDEATMRAINVDGTRRVLTAAAAAGVGHVVHASSVGAYAPRSTAVPDGAPAPQAPGAASAGGAASGGADAGGAGAAAVWPRDAVGEDWPTTGMPGSTYSRHKVAAERVVDEVQRDNPGLRVARMRPGLVFQGDAGSEIGRYFVGGLVPLGLVRRLSLPFLPLPDEAVFQVVHADDVADAVVRMLRTRADGPFNLVSGPVLGPQDVADALRAQRVVRIPVGLMRAAAGATWRLRVQPTESGWVDLLTQAPLLSSALAHAELGWTPKRTATATLTELVEGLSQGRGAGTPPLIARRGLLHRRNPDGRVSTPG